MDKSMMKGIAVGGLAMVVLGAGAVSGYKTLMEPKVAEVVAVKEVMETVTTPREQCENVQVQRQAPVKDQNRIAGTAIGGLAGGLLGSAVGNGSGRTVATIAGAVAGGYAGNQVQKNMQQKDVVSSVEQRCRTVNEKSQKLKGYDVTYRLNGQDGTVRTSFKPGDTLPVKDGQVVTTPPPSAQQATRS
ncbi:glycine zipper 2TM domain-containing protein [Hydrogenophaga sp.]|uniref:glycine zipper 2TM domain-containing protein n=1 Tax=Hydrogenophaga sp. TaxID=1904254 RepID=UPI00261A5524|nr:glycine zipper 2TM domain-containing protein [Hydrogenophaga sp.]MCW5654273.1 glycine zipper 2TM domain-containing protein [Hydrogenophaga sp.]